MSKEIIAAKFGGTSVKDAARIRHLRDNIVTMNTRRRAIVVSAPAGVTNTLIDWAKLRISDMDNGRDSLLHAVRDQFLAMAQELELSLNISAMFDEIGARCTMMMVRGEANQVYDYVVSRGEWVNAQIVAAALGFEFVDAQDFLVLDKNGRCKLGATRTLARNIRLTKRAQSGVVIGGFYGRSAAYDSRLRLFSRGGSDITGAIVAVLLGAEVYENWTDVTGIFAAHPGIVKNPLKNDTMTYKELRELTFMGFKVFHEDAVAFARKANIPIHVRCTMTPETPGTMIVNEIRGKDRRPVVTGVAGKNGFSIVTVEKYGLNDVLGVQSRIERIFTGIGVGVNTTGSIDSVTVIVETEAFNHRVREDVLRKLYRLKPDNIRVQDGIALICTVGERMRSHIGVSAKVSSALARARVNIKLELQGGSEINIIRGVREKDGPKAIRAIYRTFF